MSSTVVLDVRPPLTPGDVDALCRRVREHAEHRDAVLVLAVTAGPADARVVEVLARLALTARRHALSLRVRCDSAPLRPLLRLCGLDAVLLPDEPLPDGPPLCQGPVGGPGGGAP